jgi:hypothetical protein
MVGTTSSGQLPTYLPTYMDLSPLLAQTHAVSHVRVFPPPAYKQGDAETGKIHAS